MNAAIQQTYNDLKEYFAYAKVMLGAKNLMTIDFMVSMPSGAFKQRMHDLKIMTMRIHDYLSKQELYGQIKSCLEDIEINPDSWSLWDQANIREMANIHQNYAALTSELYARYVRLQSEGRCMHKRAQQAGDKEEAKKFIGEALELMREIATHKQEHVNTKTPYAALLQGSLDDLSEDELTAIYDELGHILKTVPKSSLTKWFEKTEQPASALSKRDIMWLGTLVLQQFGFDFQRGRLIISRGYPYSAGTSADARVLVRCSDPPRFFTTLGDVLYQGGRGLYMQHIPDNWADQPVASLSGMPTVDATGIVLESFIGSTHAFFTFLEKEIRTLPSDPGDGTYSAENLYKMKQLVPHMRHPADTVRDLSLNMTITAIERDVINGELDVNDIQDRWEADLLEDFCIKAQEKGVDHTRILEWFTGDIGAKTVQNISYLTAAQIYAEMRDCIMDFDHLISAGEFQPITDWMNKRMFSKAHSLPFSGLLMKVSSSSKLKTEVLKEFIHEKAA